MLCPELLPANACSFMALIHRLWFLFGFFFSSCCSCQCHLQKGSEWKVPPCHRQNGQQWCLPWPWCCLREGNSPQGLPSSSPMAPSPCLPCLGCTQRPSQANEHQQGARPASPPALPSKVAVLSDSAAPEKLPQDLPIVLNNRF